MYKHPHMLHDLHWFLWMQTTHVWYWLRRGWVPNPKRVGARGCRRDGGGRGSCLRCSGDGSAAGGPACSALCSRVRHMLLGEGLYGAGRARAPPGGGGRGGGGWGGGGWGGGGGGGAAASGPALQGFGRLSRSLARSLSLSLSVSKDCQEWCKRLTFITGQSRQDVSRAQSHKAGAFRNGGASADVSRRRG
jgi:hypothetical protein